MNLAVVPVSSTKLLLSSVTSHRPNDTQQIGELEASLDEGSQWIPDSIWYHVAIILLVWALVEDCEAVDGSPENIEKALQ